MNCIYDRHGFTLPEIVVAILLLTVISLVGVETYVLQRTALKGVTNKQVAVNLAESQIEDLKKRAVTEYDNPDGSLAAGVDKDTTLPLEDIPTGFNLKYTVLDQTDWPEDDAGGADTGGAEYKIVTVNCQYGADQTVKLEAFIVEKVR